MKANGNGTHLTKNGGWCTHENEVFTHPQSIKMQKQRYTYLVARYGDHPAVAMWKLWSEVDLTQMGMDVIRRGRRGVKHMAEWHDIMGKYFDDIDPVGRPVATHFATHYRRVSSAIVRKPGIDTILIDAYHRQKYEWQGPTLGHFMHRTMVDRNGGLARYKKPVMATEYGGTYDRYSNSKMLIEHRIGAWTGMVTGHAGAPMLWWFEIVDQNDLWEPYRAIKNFIAGEDFRAGPGEVTGSRRCTASDPKVWSRAWMRKGLVLGYVLDQQWASKYDDGRIIADATLQLAPKAAPGQMQITWWDADRGIPLNTETFTHSSGPLTVPIPTFQCHLAFKLVRIQEK